MLMKWVSFDSINFSITRSAVIPSAISRSFSWHMQLAAKREAARLKAKQIMARVERLAPLQQIN